MPKYQYAIGDHVRVENLLANPTTSYGSIMGHQGVITQIHQLITENLSNDPYAMIYRIKVIGFPYSLWVHNGNIVPLTFMDNEQALCLLRKI